MPHTTASRLRELWARVGTGPEPQDQKSSGTLLTWEFIGGAGGARTHDPGIMSQATRVSAVIRHNRPGPFLHVRRLSQSAPVRFPPLRHSRVRAHLVPTRC